MYNALTRGIPDCFAEAIVQVRSPQPIDVPRAQAQHRAYVDALSHLGLTVLSLPPDPRFPDGCFVEDCALLIDGTAIVTRPGPPSRHGEEQAVSEVLSAHARVYHLGPPALLEGGDTLRIGRRIYVGRSGRTNQAGVDRVREVFSPLGFAIIPVDVGDLLHLKCRCSYLGRGQLLLSEGPLLWTTFADVEIISVPAEEAYAANCVAVGDVVLVPSGYPATRRALESAGFATIACDTSEIEKADGSLTCLSVLW